MNKALTAMFTILTALFIGNPAIPQQEPLQITQDAPKQAIEAKSTPALTSSWSGSCFRCAATGFTLKLVESGDTVTGTMKAGGTPNFGDGEKPILNGKISKGKITFQVKGDPGDLAEIELTKSRDGKTMSGYGYYRGSFGLKFMLDTAQ